MLEQDSERTKIQLGYITRVGKESTAVSQTVYFKSHFLNMWLIKQFSGSVSDDTLVSISLVLAVNGIRKNFILPASAVSV